MNFGILVILTAGILTALVAGNNLSAAVGTLVGSRIVSRSVGTSIGALGFFLGLILQGESLQGSAAGILPNNNVFITEAFIIAAIVFGIAAVTRTPLSLIMALVGASAGISLRVGFHENTGLLHLIILTWVLAPVLSILAAFYLNRLMVRENFKDIWKTASFIKVFLIVVSFATAFTLGANTMGFIGSIAGFTFYVILSMSMGILVGSFLLSRGILKRIGQEMYLMRYSNALVSLLVSSVLVEGATFIGLPLSNTMTLTSSVFGTGLSYRFKALNIAPFLTVVMMWVISPLIGFILGYII
ncbi:MAG: inorganic phosphate transporter [Candidatus Thermoplasmatota archaeon]|nr:inorganic phosphate transporter [Candidatus Thermoplasmatota archaeon]